MEKNREQQLKEILDRLQHMPSISSDDVPNIDLYMDQVLTFMETNLSETRRNETDKVLTKTMINNYAKNKLLPPPEKKKYSREHMLLLIFIYYYKGVLSLEDIRALLSPLTADCFKTGEGTDISRIYDEVFSRIPEIQSHMTESAMEIVNSCEGLYPEASEESRDFLQLFTAVSTLTMEIYIKKQVIERLIDTYLKPADKKK